MISILKYIRTILIFQYLLYITEIHFSHQDIFKFILGFFAILHSKSLLNLQNEIISIIISFTFFITLFGWELWWTMAFQFAPLCNNKQALDYTYRSYLCNIPDNNITKPIYFHAISNTFSDIFLIIIIFHIGLYGSPNAFSNNRSLSDILKFIIIIGIAGVSQNMLLDSLINFFPKYCCGPNHDEWCPISWSPLAPCQFCPYNDNKLVTICFNTELLWFIVPIIIYFCTIFYTKLFL